MITWKNKPLIPDHNRNADGEMIELGIEIHQIIELLENGKEVSQRKKGISKSGATVERLFTSWLSRTMMMG